MAVKVVSVRDVTNTSTGNQTFSTSELGGATPQAAMFFISKCTANDTDTDHLSEARGFTDGTNEYVQGIMHKDAVSTTIAHAFMANDRVIGVPDWNVSVWGYQWECYATFVSFQANGVTINWADAPASAYRITVVLFAGFDNVHCDDIDMPQNIGASVSTTDPGFEPDILIVLGRAEGGWDTTGASHPRGFIGFAVNNSPIEQCFASRFSKSNVATSSCRGELSETYIGHGTIWDGYSNSNLDLDSFDANGFTVYARDQDGTASNMKMPYLALELPSGVSAWCGATAIPTSTGLHSHAETSFKPQFVMQVTSFHDALDDYGWQGAGQGIGIMDATKQSVTSIYMRNSQTTQDGESYTSASKSVYVKNAGTTKLVGAFDSFYSSGWKTNYSTVDASTRYAVALAIEEDGRTPDLMPFLKAHM